VVVARGRDAFSNTHTRHAWGRRVFRHSIIVSFRHTEGGGWTLKFAGSRKRGLPRCSKARFWKVYKCLKCSRIFCCCERRRASEFITAFISLSVNPYSANTSASISVSMFVISRSTASMSADFPALFKISEIFLIMFGVLVAALG